MNARAQDDPFDQKKREYSGSEFRMTKNVCNYDRWSLETIEARTEELSEVIPHIWDFNF